MVPTSADSVIVPVSKWTRKELEAAEKAGKTLYGIIECLPGDALDNFPFEYKLSRYDGFKLADIYLDLSNENISEYDILVDQALITNYLGSSRA